MHCSILLCLPLCKAFMQSALRKQLLKALYTIMNRSVVDLSVCMCVCFRNRQQAGHGSAEQHTRRNLPRSAPAAAPVRAVCAAEEEKRVPASPEHRVHHKVHRGSLIHIHTQQRPCPKSSGPEMLTRQLARFWNRSVHS